MLDPPVYKLFIFPKILVENKTGGKNEADILVCGYFRDLVATVTGDET